MKGFKRSLVLLTLLAIAIYWRYPDSLETPHGKAPVTTSTDEVKVKEPSPPLPTPAPERTPAQASAALADSISFDPENEAKITITGNDQLMLEMAVIAKEKYRPEMGQKISEDRHFIFFRSPTIQDQTWPVAFDQSRQKLFPVSHILHLKGIDSQERELLKSEGMAEYVYSPRIKYLSLKSTPSTVVRDFQQLKERGFDVRLEVLKEGVKSN